MRDTDFSSLELEMFREFERAELRRFENRRGQARRPRALTNNDDPTRR